MQAEMIFGWDEVKSFKENFIKLSNISYINNVFGFYCDSDFKVVNFNIALINDNIIKRKTITFDDFKVISNGGKPVGFVFDKFQPVNPQIGSYEIGSHGEIPPPISEK